MPADAVVAAGAWGIRLAAGAGFGDGTHDTTALCLQALAALSPRDRSFRLLDFGSGSGILAIAAAAHFGASVDAVEIDARAIEHARVNFALNGVEARVRQLSNLEQAQGPYDLAVANILRGVLMAHAQRLVALLRPCATLVLSGLVSTDVPELSARYAPLFAAARPEIYARNEWRALVLRGTEPQPSAEALARS